MYIYTRKKINQKIKKSKNQKIKKSKNQKIQKYKNTKIKKSKYTKIKKYKKCKNTKTVFMLSRLGRRTKYQLRTRIENLISFCTSRVAKSVKTRKPINCCYFNILIVMFSTTNKDLINILNK
jgi:hypothetical protein